MARAWRTSVPLGLSRDGAPERRGRAADVAALTAFVSFSISNYALWADPSPIIPDLRQSLP